MVGIECNHSWNFNDLRVRLRSIKDGKGTARNGQERLMFPNCSLLFGSHLKRPMVENSPTRLPETSAQRYKFSGTDGKPAHERK